MSVRLKAPAKINHFLHILKQREDGYHELETLFQLINLCDELDFELTAKDSVITYCDTLELSSEHNLTTQAAQLLLPYRRQQQGVTITLHKHIPDGAGLGGGSSDAATTLLALNQLWQCQLPVEKLIELATPLGADIPIFLLGESAFAKGVGEQLQTVTLPQAWLVLVIPPCQVNTKAVFTHPKLPRQAKPLSANAITDFASTSNHCQELVCELYPEVKQALDWLGEFVPARMTGTGSCVFGFCSSFEQATAVVEQCPQPLKAQAVEALTHSPVKDSSLFQP